MKFVLATTIHTIFYLGIIIGITNISLAQSGNVVWHEDWEGLWFNDWIITAGTWEVGIPASGPNSAYMGQECAATVLGGNYGAAVETRLETVNPLGVPDADEYPRLRFWHWFDMGGSDGGKVQIKTGQGDWETISELYNRNCSAVWSSPSLDLSAYAGDSIKIGFYFSSDGNLGSVSTGWYLDEVSLITGQPHLNSLEDWEGGLKDWSVSKGTWEVGVPSSGPAAAYQGQSCAGTVLSGDYTPLVDSRLISPYFAIPDTVSQAALKFWHWYDIGGSDYGEVQLRIKGGDWQTTSGHFSFSSGGNWVSSYIDLAQFIGDTVQVGFFLHSDGGSSVAAGWYIDNIEFPFENVTGIDQHTPPDHLTRSFTLYQNYPNPFNPATTIEFALPKTALVTLTIYNIAGEKVTALVSENLSAGRYKYHWDASGFASGVYFYRLESKDFIQTKKLLLLK